MSKIDEMLKNEKVEWKRLGEKDVCISITTGLNPRKNFKLNDSSNGELTSWYITTKDYSSNEVIEFIDGKTARITEKARKLINKRSKLQINDILFSAVGTVGKIAFVEVEPNNFDVNESTFVLKPNKKNIVPKYLVYYLRSDFIQNEVKKSLKGSTLAGIRKNKLEELVIPIPSIETQEKIVKTLDKFTNYVTELQVELQVELQARTKQYEYYRNLLLSEEYLNKLSENPEILGGGYRVKLTTLGEIGLFTRGNGLQKKDFISKGNPVIHYGEIYTKYNFETDKTFSFVNDDVFAKLRKAKFNDILIATTSENIEDVGKSVVWLGSEEIGFSGDMYNYSTTENSKYIAYYFQTTEFQKQKEKKVTGTKLIRIHGDDMAKFSISLPPIEIQNKVVQILDKFQSLLSDTRGLLPQEIEQRQKQYEYYREKLLTFDIEGETIPRQTDRQVISSDYFVILKEAADIVGVKLLGGEWKSLGEFCKCYDGTHQTPKYTNVGIPFVSVQNIKNIYGTDKFISIEAFNEYKIKPQKEDLFMTRIGDIGTCALVENNKDLAYYVTLTLLRPNQNVVLSKFLKYLIESKHGKKELDKRTLHMANPTKINLGEIPKLRFFVPSIIVQEYIVAILDRFDALINDVSQGLPKEIELRQRQYEYYREKLLDFKRSN